MRQIMPGKKDKPYTKKGIRKAPCVRCDDEKHGHEKLACYQVHVDAEPGWWRPLCESCALALQRLMLEFLGVPELDEKLLEFREKELS